MWVNLKEKQPNTNGYLSIPYTLFGDVNIDSEYASTGKFVGYWDNHILQFVDQDGDPLYDCLVKFWYDFNQVKDPY